jgi:hypothetical protein
VAVVEAKTSAGSILSANTSRKTMAMPMISAAIAAAKAM